MTVLVDMGGTYVRFAVGEGGRPARAKKYEAEKFPAFTDALEHYAAETGVEKTALLIATAAHPDAQNIWHFVNRNKWKLDPADLSRRGWPVQLILNDFEAATWGLAVSRDAAVLRQGKMKASKPSCLIGPGTGLGLGYLIPLRGDNYHVLGTMGGHLPVAATTEEQIRVLRTVEKIRNDGNLPVFDSIVSGPGLFRLYTACCALGEEKQTAQTPEELLDNASGPAFRDALRLFHEFFGLFAATVVVAGNAWGGLYLTGGVMDRLAAKGLFDFAHFEKFFAGAFVPAVKSALEQIPVLHVTDPLLSFHGLIKARNA